MDYKVTLEVIVEECDSAQEAEDAILELLRGAEYFMHPKVLKVAKVTPK